MENYNEYDEKDILLTELIQQTFHMDDEDAKPIVDEFVKYNPKILDYFDIKFLYKV